MALSRKGTRGFTTRNVPDAWASAEKIAELTARYVEASPWIVEPTPGLEHNKGGLAQQTYFEKIQARVKQKAKEGVLLTKEFNEDDLWEED
jgi:hypothetical protein